MTPEVVMILEAALLVVAVTLRDRYVRRRCARLKREARR